MVALTRLLAAFGLALLASSALRRLDDDRADIQPHDDGECEGLRAVFARG